jgi:acyl-CoA thioesterase
MIGVGTQPGETPQQVAERVGAAMAHHDAAARGAGIRLVEIGPGRARSAMTVEDRHVNGHGIGHGGYIFMLADCAFAYACNSHGVSGLSDVTVRTGAGEVVAEFRGRSRQVPGLPGPTLP